MIQLNDLYKKALHGEFLSLEEGLKLYIEAPLAELTYIANEIRKVHRPDNKVTWIIDRNVNITNVCVAGCKFCNFHRKIHEKDTYTTTFQEYFHKIDETLKHGGNQLLLQGGMHPKYGLDFYVELFSTLKKEYPQVKLHALGPAEIVHISKKSKKSYREVLEILLDAGMDSLPGAGAEILSDRVRKHLSPGKADSQSWLDVMREAHKLDMVTSATMMFGHAETLKERIEHLIQLRDVQAERPEGTRGFASFIPWPIWFEGTQLEKEMFLTAISPSEYVRLVAIARIMLSNIPNLQTSWLTVGRETAQVTLNGGANDMGSIMIEENVVSSAGAKYEMNAQGIQRAIIDAGFTPQLRNQGYEYVDMPEGVSSLM